jgi:hypothetical protein
MARDGLRLTRVGTWRVHRRGRRTPRNESSPHEKARARPHGGADG